MKNEKLVACRGTKTLLHVATDVNISVSALSQYENGRRFPTPEIARRLAEYYGKSIDWLFYGESFTVRETESVQARPHTFISGRGAG